MSLPGLRFSFGLRTKAILVISLMVALVGACGLWAINRSLLTSYQALEQKALRDDVQRVALAVEQQLLPLEDVAREWSYWDEMANYVRSRDPAFPKTNLTPEILSTSHLVGLAVFNAQGHLLHSSFTDTAAGGLFKQLVQSDSPTRQVLLLSKNKGQALCGLVQQTHTRLMLCRHPINNSAASSTSSGTAWFARPFDEGVMDKIRQTTRLNLTLSDTPPSSSEPTELTLDQPSTISASAQIEQSSPQQMIASLTLHDLSGQDMAYIQLTWPRTVTQMGLTAVADVKTQLILIGIIGVVCVIAVVDYTLVHPLKRLRDQIRAISDTQHWNQRIDCQRHDEIGEVASDTNNMLEVIEQQVEALHEMALADSLTGLPNRRAFDLRLSAALSAFQRHKRPLALLILDLDHFKQYNDMQGHQQGDRVLQALGEVLRHAVRRVTDLPARYGGEEFVVLLEDTPQAGAQLCAETILSTLRQRRLPHPANASSHIVTCSAGLAMAHEDDTPETLLSRADAALYAAKNQGRDRLVTPVSDMTGLKLG